MSEQITITTPVQGSPSYISWGSAIAGAVVAIAILVALSELCMAVGLGILKPQDPTQDTHIPAIASGGAIAWVVASIISLFLGSLATGHLARQRNETDTVIHGLVVWGLSVLLMVILGASAAGVLIGGGFSLLRGGIQATGTAVGGMAQGGGSAMGGLLSKADSSMGSQNGSSMYNWSSIKYSAENLFKQKNGPANANGATQTNPQSQANQAEPRQSNPQPNGNYTASNSSSRQGGEQNDGNYGQDSPMGLISQVFSDPGKPLQDSDRADLVSMLTANTSLNQAEATQKVDQWEQTAQKANQQYQEMKMQAEQKARDAAAATAKALANAAWVCLVGMVLGAIASMIGAHIGRPRYETVVQVTNREMPRHPGGTTPPLASV